jgi:hypothetical protein
MTGTSFMGPPQSFALAKLASKALLIFAEQRFTSKALLSFALAKLASKALLIFAEQRFTSKALLSFALAKLASKALQQTPLVWPNGRAFMKGHASRSSRAKKTKHDDKKRAAYEHDGDQRKQTPHLGRDRFFFHNQNKRQ